MTSDRSAADERRRYGTPTGGPCPRAVRCDGSVVEGAGDCCSCGCCLLLLAAAWPDE